MSGDPDPVHIVDHPGDRKTRCGKVALDEEGLPHVYVKFVQAHIDGYGMQVCTECAEGGWPS